MHEPLATVLNIVPSLLWFTFALVVLIFYRKNLSEIFSHLGSFEAMGVKFVTVQNSIDAAIDLAEKSPEWKVEIPPAEKRQALRRARQRVGLFKGVQVLWVDDHPENNLNERRMFHQLGVDIDSAKSTVEALAMQAAAKYDLVFSDMARGDDAAAGLDLLRQLRQHGSNVPVIFYMGSFDADKGIPPRAFGATNRPDELLHLTLDALERSPAADSA
jgi:CheY-like chemotaxis protein